MPTGHSLSPPLVVVVEAIVFCTMEKAFILMVPVQQASKRSVSGAIAGSQCAGWRDEVSDAAQGCSSGRAACSGSHAAAAHEQPLPVGWGQGQGPPEKRRKVPSENARAVFYAVFCIE